MLVDYRYEPHFHATSSCLAFVQGETKTALFSHQLFQWSRALPPPAPHGWCRPRCWAEQQFAHRPCVRAADACALSYGNRGHAWQTPPSTRDVPSCFLCMHAAHHHSLYLRSSHAQSRYGNAPQRRHGSRSNRHAPSPVSCPATAAAHTCLARLLHPHVGHDGKSCGADYRTRISHTNAHLEAGRLPRGVPIAHPA